MEPCIVLCHAAPTIPDVGGTASIRILIPIFGAHSNLLEPALTSEAALLLAIIPGYVGYLGSLGSPHGMTRNNSLKQGLARGSFRCDYGASSETVAMRT